MDVFFEHSVYTPCSKKGRHQTHGGNSVNSQQIFQNFFAVRFFSKSAAKYLLKLSPHLICVAALPYETVMSENERQLQSNVVINDKLQGTVVTYLRCGGIFSDRIKKGLLLSLPVKKNFKNR